MDGPLLTAGLPPLLPTLTSCVRLTPPPPSYASRRLEDPASLSESWVKDKEITGGGVSSADRNRGKMPGRASGSSSWVQDKLLGAAGSSNSSVERASRPIWRDVSWNSGKRPASRAPSADRSEKKQKAPIVITTPSTTTIVTETETEADPAPELLFAGPSFVVSPDPSELPIPLLLILPRYACGSELVRYYPASLDSSIT